MSYDTEVAADSPKGYWKLQETSGTTATDSSGLSRNGTYVGTASTHYIQNQAGLLATDSSSKSVLFCRAATSTGTWGSTGGIGRVTTTYTADWNAGASGSFSVEAWIKTAAITVDYGDSAFTTNRFLDSAIVSRRNSAPLQWMLRCASSGVVHGVIAGSQDGTASNAQAEIYSSATQYSANYLDGVDNNGTAMPGAAYTEGPFDGNAHHVVMVYDYSANTLRTYLDGFSYNYLVLPSGFAIPSNTTDGITIGSRLAGGTNGFIGYISHVAFYTSALSSSRVISHYQAGSGTYSVLYLDYITQAPYGDTLTEGVSVGATQVCTDVVNFAEAIGITPTLDLFLPVSVTLSTTMAFSATQTNNLAAAAAMSEGVTTTSTLAGLRGLPTTLSELISCTATIGLKQTLSSLIAEGLVMRVSFTSNDVDYVGWTQNANTKAVSMYDSFKYNSFAKIGGKYYGASETGIYELSGDTDAGTAIDVSVLLPNTDFGSASLKRITNAYFGVRSNGKVQLRILTNEGEDNTYTLDRENDATQEARMTFGRGLRSRYWQLELKNEAGSDFSLDEIELTVSTLTRRI